MIVNMNELANEDLSDVTALVVHYATENNIHNLFAILEKNPQINCLDFSERSSIGDTGAKILAKWLEHNKSITNLWLKQNNISFDGAQALATSLEHNQTLAALWLENNRIGDDGAKAFAECLRHNTSLTTLDLEYNSITEIGTKTLLECLDHNKNITRLILSPCNPYGNTLPQEIQGKCDLNSQKIREELQIGDFPHQIELNKMAPQFRKFMKMGINIEDIQKLITLPTKSWNTPLSMVTTYADLVLEKLDNGSLFMSWLHDTIKTTNQTEVLKILQHIPAYIYNQLHIQERCQILLQITAEYPSLAPKLAGSFIKHSMFTHAQKALALCEDLSTDYGKLLSTLWLIPSPKNIAEDPISQSNLKAYNSLCENILSKVEDFATNAEYLKNVEGTINVTFATHIQKALEGKVLSKEYIAELTRIMSHYGFSEADAFQEILEEIITESLGVEVVSYMLYAAEDSLLYPNEPGIF